MRDGYVIQFREDGTYYKSGREARKKGSSRRDRVTVWTNDITKAKVYYSRKFAHRAILDLGMGVVNTKIIKIDRDEIEKLLEEEGEMK